MWNVGKRDHLHRLDCFLAAFVPLHSCLPPMVMALVLFRLMLLIRFSFFFEPWGLGLGPWALGLEPLDRALSLEP